MVCEKETSFGGVDEIVSSRLKNLYQNTTPFVLVLRYNVQKRVLLQHYHKNSYGDGHVRGRHLDFALRQDFFCKNMTRDAHKYADTCEKCVNGSKKKNKEVLRSKLFSVMFAENVN